MKAPNISLVGIQTTAGVDQISSTSNMTIFNQEFVQIVRFPLMDQEEVAKCWTGCVAPFSELPDCSRKSQFQKACHGRTRVPLLTMVEVLSCLDQT